MIQRILENCGNASLFANGTPTGVNERNAFGDTPLQMVSRWGEVDSVKALLQAGAEADAIGEKDRHRFLLPQTLPWQKHL